MSVLRVSGVLGPGLLSVLLIAGPSVAENHVPPPPPVFGATPPPPPPPVSPERQLQVYYSVNGQVLGPFNKEELQARIAAGELNRQTLVWMEGMADWQAAATVQAVAPLLATAPPPTQFNAEAFHSGTWEYSGTVTLPDGSRAQYSENMTYRPDGSVTGFGQLSANQGYGIFVMNLSSTGTWKAEAKTENSYILSLNITTTGSSQYGSPSVETINNSALLNVIDRNTVAAQDGSRRYRTGN